MALVRHFGSVEDMLRALGLTDEQQQPGGGSSVSEADALAALARALAGVRVSVPKLWATLRDSAKDIGVYKQLVTLRRDVPITTPRGLGYASSPVPSRPVDEDLRVDVDGNALAHETIVSREGALMLDDLRTQHFRYVGERGAPLETELALSDISPSLVSVLGSLRLTYNKLDRKL